MAPITILVSESSRFPRTALHHLQSLGRVDLADITDRRELLSKVRQADILWVRLRHSIDREVMEAAPHLRAIASPTTGLNHIDIAEAQRRNIRVLSLRGETDFLRTIYATAEHTLALMLALIRNLPAAARHASDGEWNRDLFLGRELNGKTVGIVGYGRVGRMVAQYVSVFGARVLVTDPKAADESVDSQIEVTTLDHLLRSSDLVTLHVNLDETTKGFFGKREFSLMKPRAWFINTSRGEIIDEAALLDALRVGHVAGAALDVLSGENSGGMQHHPLVQYARTHPNLLITPHIGGCTVESTEKTEIFLAEQVVAFVNAGMEEALAHPVEAQVAEKERL